MVTSTGIITTIAGTGTQGSSGDGGAATSVQFSYIFGVSVDISGNVYISDYGSNKIRMVNSAGIISTFAGTGVFGNSGDGGAATSAQLKATFGVSVDTSGNVYIADQYNFKIRVVKPLPVCSIGSYLSGLTCQSCLPGTYNPSIGSTSCVQCASGTHFSTTLFACCSSPLLIKTQSVPFPRHIQSK